MTDTAPITIALCRRKPLAPMGFGVFLVAFGAIILVGISITTLAQQEISRANLPVMALGIGFLVPGILLSVRYFLILTRATYLKITPSGVELSKGGQITSWSWHQVVNPHVTAQGVWFGNQNKISVIPDIYEIAPSALVDLLNSRRAEQDRSPL